MKIRTVSTKAFLAFWVLLLTWDPYPQAGSISNFRLETSFDNGSSWAVINPFIPPTATSVVDPAGGIGPTACYRLIAVSSTQESPPSNVACETDCQ